MSAASTPCTRPPGRWPSAATPCSRPPSRRCAGSACAPGGSARSPPPRSSCSTTSTAARHDQQGHDAPTENGSVSTAVRAFIGVVAGGLLTVAAQATAESLKARAAGRARQEQRDRATRGFQRETLIELQAAMADYRAALARDRSQILPLRGTEQQVSAA